MTALGRAAWVGILACLGLSLFATAALGKGASSVVIQGPGLAQPLTISSSESEDPVDQVWALMIDSGFWQEACGHCRGVEPQRPPGDLGPRYTLTYDMNLETTTPPNQVVQYVYPFAQRQPVTYMPGGGWYVARPRLKRLLIGIGLPATVAEATRISADILRHRGDLLVATAAHHGSSRWVALVALVAVVAGLLVFLRSHRPRTGFMNRRRRRGRLAPRTPGRPVLVDDDEP